MTRLFLDMDGVLADFDRGFYELFGQYPDRSNPANEPPEPVIWSTIAAHGSFYRDLEPMPDAFELLAYTRQFSPVILTGLPKTVPNVARQKMEWVRQHVGDDMLVIPCASRDKSLWCRPGDVLVDDWVKYRGLWQKAGGVFITHRTATESIAELQSHGFTPQRRLAA